MYGVGKVENMSRVIHVFRIAFTRSGSDRKTREGRGVEVKRGRKVGKRECEGGNGNK